MNWVFGRVSKVECGIQKQKFGNFYMEIRKNEDMGEVVKYV